MKDYDSRELTDALTMDEDFIFYKLSQGPQLCMVLNENLTPKESYTCSKRYYVFIDIVDGEERQVVLVGATKCSEHVDRLKTFKAFRRPVEPDYFEEGLVEINGLTFQLFKKFTPADIIGVLGQTFDVQQVWHQFEERMGVLCHYFDEKNSAKLEGRVLSQLDPIILNKET